MILSKIIGNSGNVHDILGLSGTEVYDISNDKWGSTRGVLSNLVFENAILKKTKIRPNFVECEFYGCSFENVNSDGQFWGASNLWKNCRFSNVRIGSAISPQNKFENCNFENVTLKKYASSEKFVGSYWHR